MEKRGESIEEYANAFKKKDGNREAASVLYKKMEWLFSMDEISREMKVRCIAEEIDNILCAGLSAAHEEGSVKSQHRIDGV